MTNEGFLICLDVRGFKIKEFTEKEIRDVFETRRVIETYVVGRAADELSPADLRGMQDGLRTMANRADEGDHVGLLEADKEFHLSLIRSTNNQRLLTIMENLRDYVSIFGLKALAYPGHFKKSSRSTKQLWTPCRKKTGTRRSPPCSTIWR